MKKCLFTQSVENQHDSMTGKWESSDATEHTKSCHGQCDWLHPRTLARLINLKQRKICEFLEISKFEVRTKFDDDTIKVLNRDWGNNY